MKLVPLHDNVVIEPNAAETKTAGGILIPDTATQKVTRGKVIAVGAGRRYLEGTLDKLIPTKVQVGDEVLYGKYTGTEVEVDGKTLLITSEADILCMVQYPGQKR